LLRLPVLLCGLAALLVLPFVVRGWVGRRAALLFAALLAVSPLLVLYSRIARSYLPLVLFGVGAVVAFEVWWRERSRRAGAAFVGLAAVAVWFHLGAAPLVAAPFPFALGEVALPGR